MASPAPPYPTMATDRTSVRDVYWLNAFGPAFVERWGARLDGVGVRQIDTSTGGRVIWAADTPFLFDPEVSSTEDYPWKQPFYDALGRDTFVHRTQIGVGAGVPSLRRSTAAGTPPRRVHVTSRPPEPVVEAVSVLRRLDFFADRVGSDAEVAAAVLDDYQSSWGHDPADDEPLLDLELLRFDPGRVWWQDTEADVGPGNDAYVTAIEGWAAISRGALRPSRVAEAWDPATGTVAIIVSQGAGSTRSRRVTWVITSTWGCSTDSTRSSRRAPFRFRMHTAFDQTAFVIVCDGRERRVLEERGWSFAG